MRSQPFRFSVIQYKQQTPYQWLFTDNETNEPKLYGHELKGHFKDAFHEYVVGGDKSAVSQQTQGTKVAPHLSVRRTLEEFTQLFCRQLAQHLYGGQFLGRA